MIPDIIHDELIALHAENVNQCCANVLNAFDDYQRNMAAAFAEVYAALDTAQAKGRGQS